MDYIDANVFIYAALYEGPKAQAAAELVRGLAVASRHACTSVLALDEVVYATGKAHGRQKAIVESRKLLLLPGLQILDATADDWSRALDLMADSRLKPRDALHAATALAHGCKRVVSDDSDFDGVKGLRRLPLA